MTGKLLCFFGNNNNKKIVITSDHHALKFHDVVDEEITKRGNINNDIIRGQWQGSKNNKGCNRSHMQ